MKKVLSKEASAKNRVMFISIVVILITVIALVFAFGVKRKEVVNDLKINYSKGEEVKLTKFKKDFTEERTITITNTSKEAKTYSLEWSDVSNTLKKQNAFIYEIKGSGDRVAELGKSQVPGADSVVFAQVLIEAGKTQTYTITFTYSGSESAKFAGKLKVKSKKVDTKKLEKEEEKRNKELDEKLKKQREEIDKKKA